MTTPDRHRITRKLGPSAIDLPVLGFGSASLGSQVHAFDIDTARGAIAAAYDAGIAYFDTAPLYSYGMAERLIGDGLRRWSDRPIVSTKVGRLLRSGAPAHPVIPAIPKVPFGIRHDYSRDGALRSVEDSLQRLGTDRVDILLIHDIDSAAHGADAPAYFRQAMEGALPALAELRDQGVIGALGLGVNMADVCINALDHADLDCCLIAGRYTLLDTAILDDLLPKCRARGVSLIVGGPYNSGVLAGAPPQSATFDYRPAPPEVLARVAELSRVAEAHGVALPAAAIQFPLGEPAVASVIPGMRTADEVRQNLAHFNAEIPAAFWQALKDEGLLRRDAPVPE